MSEDDVRAMLREEIGWKGAARFAQRIGVSASYLSDVMNGRRAANEKVLAAIGLERRIVRISSCVAETESA